MSTNAKYLQRAIGDFERVQSELVKTGAIDPAIVAFAPVAVPYLAAQLVVAARLDALEDALIAGLTAGEDKQ